MFLKNRNIIFKIKISKVTDYAALNINVNDVCRRRLVQTVFSDAVFIFGSYVLKRFYQMFEFVLVILRNGLPIPYAKTIY